MIHFLGMGFAKKPVPPTARRRGDGPEPSQIFKMESVVLDVEAFPLFAGLSNAAR